MKLFVCFFSFFWMLVSCKQPASQDQSKEEKKEVVEEKKEVVELQKKVPPTGLPSGITAIPKNWSSKEMVERFNQSSKSLKPKKTNPISSRKQNEPIVFAKSFKNVYTTPPAHVVATFDTLLRSRATVEPSGDLFYSTSRSNQSEEGKSYQFVHITRKYHKRENDWVCELYCVKSRSLIKQDRKPLELSAWRSRNGKIISRMYSDGKTARFKGSAISTSQKFAYPSSAVIIRIFHSNR